MNKKSAQSGVAAPLLLLLAVVGLIGYTVISSSAEFKNSLFAQLYPKRESFAASNKAVFSNLSADLKENTATFNFSYSGSAGKGYSIDVSTSADMKQNFLKDFAKGISSPIVVTNPQSRYAQYKCSTIIYWWVRVGNSNVRSSASSTNVNCTVPTPSPSPIFSPTPEPTGIGTTTSGPSPTISPTPTPTPISGPLSTPPPTSISKIVQASDGTWCYDFDGADYVNPGFPPPANINVGYSTQGFCQDNTGVHGDYCETGNSTSRDYYCQSTWDGTKYIHVVCAPGGYVCQPGSYIGDVCRRGACGPSTLPSSAPASNPPSVNTLQGSDGTYCYDSDGNGNIATKGTCQDNAGTYTDYCSTSDNIQDYYCTGNWTGSSYTNVRCETGTHGCTSQFGLTCSDGACK